MDTHRKFVLSRILYGISPPCHPLTRVFALFITSTTRSLTSSLPVSNSNQSVGRRGGGGGGRLGGHTKEQPMGVFTTPDCGFCPLSLLTTGQEFLRDFSSYFDCLSPGKYYVTRLFWLIRSSFSFTCLLSWINLLFWAWHSVIMQAHVWWDREICIK